MIIAVQLSRSCTSVRVFAFSRFRVFAFCCPFSRFRAEMPRTTGAETHTFPAQPEFQELHLQSRPAQSQVGFISLFEPSTVYNNLYIYIHYVYIIFYSILLYCIILYYIKLYYSILYYITLYYIILFLIVYNIVKTVNHPNSRNQASAHFSTRLPSLRIAAPPLHVRSSVVGPAARWKTVENGNGTPKSW